MWDEYWKKFTTVDQNGNIIGNGFEFENLVECLLSSKFGEKVHRTKKSHDHNRDFWIHLEDESIWAECKNYQNTIAMDVLAPTLIMAQVYDVNTILFFCRSEINHKAKDKILAFGEKSKKRIFFFDGDSLEDLIWSYRNVLPPKYRPRKNIKKGHPKSSSTKLCSVHIYFAKKAITGAVDVDEDEELIPYEMADIIRYGEIFGLDFTITNNDSSDPIEISIAFDETALDRYCFQYLNRKVQINKYVFHKQKLQGGEGCAISLNIKPIKFKSELVLPGFIIKYKSKSNIEDKYTIPPKILNCKWIGKTSLLGTRYRKLFTRIKDELINNNKFSYLLLSGSSGTGKTRMLEESISAFIEYGYGIINLSGRKNYSSKYLLQEIIAFLYEIPSTEILLHLEDRYNQASHINYGNNDTTVSLKMLLDLNSLSTEESINQYLENCRNILFCKIAQSKIVISIDNIQFCGKAFLNFLLDYIYFSSNCNNTNKSVILGTLNLDYMTEDAAEFLFNAVHTDISNRISEKVYGFSDNDSAKLFLRELMRINDDDFDDVLELIIDKVGKSPYNLYQTVQFLEERNAISQTYNGSGYIIESELIAQLMETTPDQIDSVLFHRWGYLKEHIKEKALFRICSAILLFDNLSVNLASYLSIKIADLNYLSDHHFLRLINNTDYIFDHDIIRNFYYRNFSSHYFDSIKWLQYKGNEGLISDNLAVYSLLKFSSKECPTYFISCIGFVKELCIPYKLAPIFWQSFLSACIKSFKAFSSPAKWIDWLYFACKMIRESCGSQYAQEAYKMANNSIKKHLKRQSYAMYCAAYRPFLHSYCDVLLQSDNKELAAIFAANILTECKKNNDTNMANRDERMLLRAIMLNRWYCAYNAKANISEFAIKRESLMQESKSTANKIKSAQKKRLMKYLNCSDEGYNFYNYYHNKDILFKTWDSCLQGMPSAVPEKTLNYYRKQIQYNLIVKDFSAANKNIMQGRKYLSCGKYAHEALIFNTFFLMAEVIAYIQKDVIKYSDYIEKMIIDLLQIQNLLGNQKLGDIIQLKAILAFYNRDRENVYYSFKKAYEEYRKKTAAFYWIKSDLLLKNIQYAFSVLGIYEDKFDINFLPRNFRNPLSKDSIYNYNATGILQTIDCKINFPLIA